MPITPTKPTGRYARLTGCWTAWCAAGRTPAERAERIENAPETMRDELRRHVETALAVRRGTS